jgi:hypothetical protein
MAVRQTIIITDTSGRKYSSVEELMEQMDLDTPRNNTRINKVMECTADGTLVGEAELSSGNVATVNRIWHDTCWTEFSALDGADDLSLADSGWTVVSSDRPVLATRQDDTFGQ